MSHGWIRADRVFDGTEMLDNASLRIEAGQVVELSTDPRDGVKLSGCLSPGFVDLQVNGGGGVLLNNTPTREGMAAMAEAHRQFGTVAIMPTVITDHPGILDQAAEAILAAKGDPGILGLHIEGPHICDARRGTHAQEHVRTMDDRTMKLVSRLRGANVPVMITLAPEAVETSQIAALAQMGAIVSLGHTDGTAEQIEEVLNAGATCGTHLFNAMSPMQSRAPGAVGAILNSDAHFGLICDGHHVDYRMIQLAVQASKPGRAFLVSDAMATVGGPDQFDLYGCKVRQIDGRLVNSEGNLAGAHLTQAQGIQRLVNHAAVSLETALQMAISTPAAIMRQTQLSEMLGRDLADVVLIADDLSVKKVAF